MRKKSLGVIFSYLLIVVDIIVGILFVPFLLKNLGDDEYGLYKLMLSTASYLSILDFGIGGTMTRYIVKYKTENDERNEKNFIAMGLILYGILATAVIVLGFILCSIIPYMYSNSISQEKMQYAQIIFILIFLKTTISLFNHAFTGILSAYEEFFYTKASNIIQVLMRVGLIVGGVMLSPSALIIVVVDLFLAMLFLLINIIYCKFKVKIKIKLYKWDKPLAKEALIFTVAILMQTIINQFNSNVDSVVLGIFCTTSIVAMYSIALQIYIMYNSLSTAISSVFLPTISASVFNGESNDEITKKVVIPSRLQLIILLLALTGFYIFGQEFIVLWVGEGYEMVYMLACILLTASTLELSQNTITSVLKAKNMLHGQSLILLFSTIGNCILTVILVPILGPIGAAIGTAFSMIFGYGIGLNLYYHFKVKLNLKYYFKETFKGIFLSAIISLIIGFGVTYFIPKGTLLLFALRVVVYLIIYLCLMFVLGFNKDEKKLIKKLCNKMLKMKKVK